MMQASRAWNQTQNQSKNGEHARWKLSVSHLQFPGMFVTVDKLLKNGRRNRTQLVVEYERLQRLEEDDLGNMVHKYCLPKLCEDDLPAGIYNDKF